jgi:hypothetical protein
MGLVGAQHFELERSRSSRAGKQVALERAVERQVREWRRLGSNARATGGIERGPVTGSAGVVSARRAASRAAAREHAR